MPAVKMIVLSRHTLTADLVTQVFGDARNFHVCCNEKCAWFWYSIYSSFVSTLSTVALPDEVKTINESSRFKQPMES